MSGAKLGREGETRVLSHPKNQVLSFYLSILSRVFLCEIGSG